MLETALKLTTTFRNAFTIRNAKKVLDNPRKAVELRDGVAATYRRSRVDIESEVNGRAERLCDLFDADLETVEEYEREIRNDDSFQKEFRSRWDKLDRSGVLKGTTIPEEAETLYIVCRLLKPEIVVQTGVQHGSFDAHTLAALKRNGEGELHSVDLPNNGPDGFGYGYLIPDELRENWELHLGDAKDILPGLLSELEEIDLFLHDSEHTREHMRWEYETAAPYLKANGVLSSHDIIKNNEFQNCVDERHGEMVQIFQTGFATF